MNFIMFLSIKEAMIWDLLKKFKLERYNFSQKNSLAFSKIKTSE